MELLYTRKEALNKDAIRPSVCLFHTPSSKNCIWLLYRVAQNKIPHRRICNISTTSGLILKILEAA